MSSHVLKPPKLRRYHILESISSKTFIPREYQVNFMKTVKITMNIVYIFFTHYIKVLIQVIYDLQW